MSIRVLLNVLYFLLVVIVAGSGLSLAILGVTCILLMAHGSLQTSLLLLGGCFLVTGLGIATLKIANNELNAMLAGVTGGRHGSLRA